MNFEIVNYNINSITVNSQPPNILIRYTNSLKELGGKWNNTIGWIFSKKKKDELQQLLDKIKNGEIEPENEINIKFTNQKVNFEISAPYLGDQWVISKGEQIIPTIVVKIEKYNPKMPNSFVRYFTLKDEQQEYKAIMIDLQWKIEGWTEKHTLTKILSD